MEFIDPKALAYADRFSSVPDPVLEALEQYTLQAHPKAHMLSGAVQGSLLSMVAGLMAPSRILEIGTFTGYSALCLLKGLPENGLLHTIESREEDAATAQQFFEKTGRAAQIKLHIGDAHAIIPTLNEIWDLVFIDADKVSYIDYYEMVKPCLRKGGLIIADNVLFHGDVLQESLKGKNAKAVQAFNDHVKADPDIDHVLLTVRDGLMFVRKK